jgi:hypothetical protein
VNRDFMRRPALNVTRQKSVGPADRGVRCIIAERKEE